MYWIRFLPVIFLGPTEQLRAGAGGILDMTLQVLKYDVVGDGTSGGGPSRTGSSNGACASQKIPAAL